MKKNTKSLLIAITILCVFIIVLQSLLLIKNKVNVPVNKSYHYYFNGVENEIEIESNYEIVNNKLLIEGEHFYSIPLYANDEILLTSSMVYYSGTDFNLKMVECMASASKDENGDVNFTYKNEKASSGPGLLYDGEYVYVVLRDSTLNIDNSTYSLPALSYVYFDGLFVSFYDFNKKEGFYNSVTAGNIMIDSDLYSINVSEAVYENEVTSQLMFTDPSALSSIFE